MPKDQKYPWTGAPAHTEGEGLVPSKPGEVVSKVTSHRIDLATGPTPSQDQALGESPPSLRVHTRGHQRSITCWGGHLHREQHSTNETDSKVQKGRYKHRGLRSCGTQRSPGEAAQEPGRDPVSSITPPPGQVHRPSGPAGPTPEHLPPLSEAALTSSTLNPPTMGCGARGCRCGTVLESERAA